MQPINSHSLDSPCSYKDQSLIQLMWKALLRNCFINVFPGYKRTLFLALLGLTLEIRHNDSSLTYKNIQKYRMKYKKKNSNTNYPTTRVTLFYWYMCFCSFYKSLVDIIWMI